MSVNKSVSGIIATAAASLFATAAHAAPTVNVSNAQVVEGIPGNTTTVKVPIKLSQAASAPVSITYTVTNGSATTGSDVVAKTATTTINAGGLTKTATLTLINDDTFEPTEAFSVTVTNVSSSDPSVVLGDDEGTVTVLDDDIPPGALVGSLGSGTSTPKVEATASDPFNVTNWFLASGYGNSITLGGSADTARSLDQNGRPTTGNTGRLSNKAFTKPSTWPPATATDANTYALPTYIKSTTYLGAFDPKVARKDQWDQKWTVGVNGNDDVWKFFGGVAGTALEGASAPTADGSCPAGTTLSGTLSSRFGALSNDETDLFDGVSGDYDVCKLPRRINANLTLTNDNIYEIQTGFPGTYVGNGEALRSVVPTPVKRNLTVQPGTLIFGGDNEALVITRGSKITAKGKANAPIVMTSENQLIGRFDGNPATPVDAGSGQWAGLALTGNARDTTCPGADYANCDRPLEGNVGNYGGNNDNDNSGYLQYVVIRHAGNDIDGNGNELNGLTLGGVGRATKISYVQVHRGFDDGVEMFGGNVAVSNLVLSGAYDDSFDFDNGWTGAAQFVYIVQQDSVSPGLGRFIEGGTSIATSAPISTFALLANFTAVGPASRIAGGSIDDGQGVLLRGGVRAQLWNSVFTGDQPKGCLDLDNTETFNRALEQGGSGTSPGPHLFIRNTIFDCQLYSTVENG